MTSATLALLVAAPLLFATGDAPASALEWRAPAPCPTQVELDARVRQLTAVERASAAPVHARARVVVTDGVYSVVLELRSPTGASRRELHSASCELLAQASALLYAIAVDPLAVAESLPAAASDVPAEPVADPVAPAATMVEPVTPETSTSVTSPISRAASASATDRRERSRLGLRGGLRPAVSLGYGLVPAPDVSFALHASLQGARWRVELGGAHTLSRPARLDGFPEVGADVYAWTGSARGCWQPLTRARVELPLCAQLELGAVTASGVGVEQTRTESTLVLGVGAALALAVPLTPWLAVWLELQGYGAPRRASFSIAGSDALVFETASLGVRAAVGLELRLPTLSQPPRGG
ncbi:MAG: hypothetical protein H6713_18285 [Myxococcales bacterium]|nr:hypothetical protein [Myxococcales bacterium]